MTREHSAFQDIPSTTLADVLRPGQALAPCIRPLWSGMPRIAGPAYTVRCGTGDNLMLHAAIYRAAPGSIVVVEGGDTAFALAGGNVCAVAQRRGILGFVLDGAVRDLSEIRAIRFPVFALGVTPVAGTKNAIGTLNARVRCGGVVVEPADIVVADEDGVVVVPSGIGSSTLQAAMQKLTIEATQPFEAWEADHRLRIDKILRDMGFEGRVP